jgi:hypothetical protein
MKLYSKAFVEYIKKSIEPNKTGAMTFSITTISIMTLSLTTLIIMGLIVTLSINDTQRTNL